MPGHKINYLKPNNDILFIQENLAAEFGLAPGDAAWKEQLAAKIDELIVSDFPKLVNSLYRLDVSEEAVKQVLKQYPNRNAGELIAGLVIDRMLKKIESRQESRPNSAIPDDEKW